MALTEGKIGLEADFCVFGFVVLMKSEIKLSIALRCLRRSIFLWTARIIGSSAATPSETIAVVRSGLELQRTFVICSRSLIASLAA